MNSEQLVDFLEQLSQNYPPPIVDKKEETEIFKKYLHKCATNTHFAVNFIASNYTDVDLIQGIIGQLLALYYKGGILRLYSLQFVPGFISLYMLGSGMHLLSKLLLNIADCRKMLYISVGKYYKIFPALSKKQQKSISVFETFFIAIYNEEIMCDKDSTTKKTEEVRIPSIRYPSIYHDPSKIHSNHPEIGTMKTNNSVASVLTTVRIGPYPSYSKFSAENKYIILNRIMKSVNQHLFVVSSEVASRNVCLAALSICRSGFSFPDTGFRSKVLDSQTNCQEVIDDFSKKPRQQVAGSLLLEFLNASYLALFNGQADLALRAIDSIHLRSQYEMLPDVLLVVNSIRNSLLDNPLSMEKRGELMWTRQPKEISKRKDMVTNASLRMKRMPEDIPVQEQAKEKEHSTRFGELVEEGMDHLHDLRKKVVGIGLHHKIQRRRKSVEHEIEMELQPIKEEKPSSNSEEVGSPANEKATKMVLNGDEIERRLRDISVVELDYEKDAETSRNEAEGNGIKETDKGAFSIAGLRHMDSDEFANSPYR